MYVCLCSRTTIFEQNDLCEAIYKWRLVHLDSLRVKLEGQGHRSKFMVRESGRWDLEWGLSSLKTLHFVLPIFRLRHAVRRLANKQTVKYIPLLQLLICIDSCFNELCTLLMLLSRPLFRREVNSTSVVAVKWKESAFYAAIHHYRMTSSQMTSPVINGVSRCATSSWLWDVS